MQQIFVELYNYGPAWHALPADKRRSYTDIVLKEVEGLAQHGIQVIGWGMNDPNTDRRAPFDFFCVYRVPSVEFQRAFETNIRASGWYDYFEQVNISGAVLSPSALLDANVTLRKPQAQKE
jgi:hypothetical protein